MNTIPVRSNLPSGCSAAAVASVFQRAFDCMLVVVASAMCIGTTSARAQDLLPFYDLPIAQHPESATFDPTQRAFYAGSVLAKGIVRVEGVTGATTQFVDAADLPYLAITGLRADPVARTLWVCNVEPSAFIAYAAGGGPPEALQSALVRLDLDTGAVLAITPLSLVPGMGGPGYLCNDISLDSSGYAYVTESAGGRVFRVSPDSSSSTTLVTDPVLLGPTAGETGSLGVNGIAFSPVDGQIYVTNPANGRMFRFPADPLASSATLEEVLLSEPVYGDGMIIDPNNGMAYAVSSVPDAERVIKSVQVTAAAPVKPVGLVEWPDIPRVWESPTAGTYAEGRFYVADAAFGRLQGSEDNEPGLVFGVQLPTPVTMVVTGVLHPHHDDSPNTILNDSIPVTLFGSSVANGDAVDFTASTIDPASLRFGPAGGSVDPASVPEFNIDVDTDGDDDARFSFLMSDVGIGCDDTDVTLTGETVGGDAFITLDLIETDCNAACH